MWWRSAVCGKTVEHGLVRPGFVPPPETRQSWFLTRHCTEAIRERTRAVQRLEQLLEDAGLSAVVSGRLGKSSRAMPEALIAGALVPAEMAKAGVRTECEILAQTLTGRVTDHHEFLALTEIGVHMSRFPTAAPRASWAGMRPGEHEPAGRHTSGTSHTGEPWPKGALGLAVAAAVRGKGTQLAARCTRIAVRRGEKRVLVAVGDTVLASVWHMLTNDAGHAELGGSYCSIQRTGRAGQPRCLAGRSDMLGHHVSLPSGEAV